MNAHLDMAIHRRSLMLDRSLGAHQPTDPDSPCAVQRIRPGCKHFTSEALRARRKPAPGVWQRVQAWLRSMK